MAARKRVAAPPAADAIAEDPPAPYLPHIDLLLRSLRITRERLASRSKIAVDTELLSELLRALAGVQPFSADFYRTTYPDIAEGEREGRIPDLWRHMVEQGYLEGRLGAPVQVDEAFYLDQYPDVRAAVESGEIESATKHYVVAGAAEGRTPNPGMQNVINHWNRVLLRDGGRHG